MALRRSVVRWAVLPCLLAPAVPSFAQAEPGPTSPVVLELFTSQGCSSCPAAEELLSRLGLDERTRAMVIPLAYHVDYWNRLGWWDPFSSRAWSLRQEAYQRILRVADGAYTPQLVVNGRSELNGTQRARVLSEIEAAQHRRPPARIAGDVRLTGSQQRAFALDVSAEVLDEIDARKLHLLVALFENGIFTHVERGENGGRTLRNDFIVRRLETAFAMEAARGARKAGLVGLKLDPGWKLPNLGVVAILQDPRTLRIHAAATLPVAKEPGGRADGNGSGR